MATAEATLDKFLDGFKSLPASSKILLLVGVPLVIGGLVLLLSWFQAPEYRVLFSNVSDRDGGAIIAALNQQNIPYKLSEGGDAILVPAGQVHDTRLRLASQGLPRGSVAGFELMEGQKLGITQFQEQVNYQRALEGELARSIQTLSSVQAARVHLAIPKPSIFIRDKQKPTASVLLNLFPGKTLERSQIAGIAHLVSSSLPDLPLSSVSIVDQNGTLLSNDGPEHPGDLDPNQLSYLHQMEESYNRRVIEILSPIVGAENVRAQITLDLDFSQAESTAEIFKPNTTVSEASIRSQSISDAGGSNAGLPAQGIPGALSNQPPGGGTAPITGGAPTNPSAAAGAAAGNGVLSSGGRRDAVTNYEVDKTVRFVRNPTGSVRRVSAAIVVNNKQITAANGKTSNKALTAEEMKQINALVREAIGFQEKRGDTLNVLNTPFNQAKAEELSAPPFWENASTMATLKELGKTLALAGLALYLVFGLLKPVLKQITTYAPPKRKQAEAEEYEEFTPIRPKVPDPIEIAREIAKQDARVVAGVVKNWVSGE
ncbi:MAG: flagellar basal body M-ring protein FliF [Burkholderiaceae bacterium]|nr:MAG: flagellar basal body M-ring protein FliF [Burkholderiaceae bacterium]